MQSGEKRLLTSNPDSRYGSHLSYTKVWMNNYRLLFYHHCFQIPGEAAWEYDPMIIDQGRPCSSPVVTYDYHLGSQIRQGFWWRVDESFSITIKLPISLYGENSQDSFTHTLLLQVLPHTGSSTGDETLTSLHWYLNTDQQWKLVFGMILCNSSKDLENPKGMGKLPQWPHD